MGKRWRKYSVGPYRLGQLNGRAVVRWRDGTGVTQRRVLCQSGASEVEARAALDAWARRVAVIKAEHAQTVAELYAAYTQDRERDGKIIANFRDSWRALGQRFGRMPVDAVNADVCRDYAAERTRQGVKPGTIWTELTRLRSCLNWAAKRHAIARAPYVWVPSKPPPRNTVLSEDQARSLIDACVSPHLRLFVVLALTTGARSGAILGLTWDRVDFERGLIDFREPEVINPLTKRVRKARAVVPIADEVRAALQTAKAGTLSEYVIEWDGQRVAKVRKGFEMAARRAGLPAGTTPHVLRHTAASWLDSEGVAMERISRLLGHRDLNTTRTIYAKPDVETLRPSAEVLSMRLKRSKGST